MDEQEKAERAWDYFCETVIASGVLTHYEEAINEYDRIANNFNIEMTFTEWIRDNY